ncbi:MAG: ATP-binding protein [Pseudobdellovibrionaceae bacterium]
MYIERLIPIVELSKRKSLFLLGPRQTGKSQLIKKKFPEDFKINLLMNADFLRYQKDPGLLIRELSDKKSQLIVIDEIQRLPELLNDVHFLIEEVGHRFLLTGSSARKLKKTGVNLLGGRASKMTMHPFVRAELKSKFSLEKALSYGLLPSVYFSDDPSSQLKDYVGLYLKEEIMSEGLTRNLPAFSRFLEAAAGMNGKMVNYTKIANDAQLAPSTAYEHFKVLEDTLIAKEVLAFEKTNIRKAISTSKFYFFDLGVVRAILGKGRIQKSDADYGDYFESYIYQELNCYSSYHKLSEVKYWRSKSNFEVDFIFDDSVAIEVKATTRVISQDLRGLKALSEEKLLKRYLLVSQDKKNQTIDGIQCIYWEDFLNQLADGKI